MKKIIQLLTTLSLMLTLVSCGGGSKKVVSDFDFYTLANGSDKLVATEFTLDVGSAELPTLTLPLPSNYGTLSLDRVEDKNKVNIALNLSEVLKLPRTIGELPNGTPVPVDTNGAGIIVIPVSGINGYVYVAQKSEMTLIGFAFSIKQLDGIGREVGNAGIFPSFKIGKVDITAGIYTSDDSGQTGLAAFANLGGLWNMSGAKRVYPITYESGAFNLGNIDRLSRRQKRRMYKKLKRILKKRQTLSIVRK